MKNHLFFLFVAMFSLTLSAAPQPWLELRDAVTRERLAAAEFDALYAQFCEEFLNAGYQEIIDERLAAFEAGNTTRLPDTAK